MIDPELLKILCCPETKQDVAVADSSLIEKLNQKIESGQLKNRGGEAVDEKIDGGLIRSDQKYLYPIRDDIPIMLIAEGVSLEGFL